MDMVLWKSKKMWLIGVSYKKHDLVAFMVLSLTLDVHDLVFLLLICSQLLQRCLELRSGDFCDETTMTLSRMRTG